MRRAAAGALILTLAVTTACASTTQGAGSVLAPTAAGTSAAPTDFPSSIPPLSTAAPATSAVPSSAPPPTAGSGSLSAAPAPAECQKASDCKLVKSWNVGDDYIVAVFSAPDAAGGVGSSVLLLGQGDTPIEWHVLSGETPGELLCKVAIGTLRNCVLVDYVGAHAATAYPLTVSGNRLLVGKAVGTDTPAMHAVDLDHDLRVDAIGLNNNYKPDYASGHVQWQTWRRTTDGMTLSVTGCGPLKQSAPPRPSTFLTGTCDLG